MGRQTTKTERLHKFADALQEWEAFCVKPRQPDDLDLHAKQVLATLTEEQARAVGHVLKRSEAENRRMREICAMLINTAKQAALNSVEENLRRTSGIRAAGRTSQAEDAKMWMEIARLVCQEPPDKRVAQFNALSFKMGLREPGHPLGASQRAKWLKQARGQVTPQK